MEVPEYDEPDVAVEVGGSVNGARGVSLLKSAEQRRAQRERSLFLDIPSWDGALIGEYRLIDPDDLKRMQERQIRRARSSGGQIDTVANDIELIVLSCVGLYARDPENGDRVAIEDDAGIVNFGRIAPILGKEDIIRSNADAVRYLTAEGRQDDGTYIQNDIAISIHASSISRWMRDPSRRSLDIDALLGEL